jgi:hypothetical protein
MKIASFEWRMLMKTRLLALACTGLLVACGGGGSTDSSVTADPIDRYIGTWNRKCDTWSSGDVSDLNGKGVNVVEVLKFEKASATQANYVYTLKVFANTDVQCTGQPIATVIKSGQNNASLNISNSTATMTTGFGANQLTYLGTQALSTETVDKVQITEAKLTELKGNITVGTAIIKTDSDLFAPVSTQALTKFKSASQILFNAIQNGETPSAMQEDEYWVITKQ